MTNEELNQLRTIIREEIKPLDEKIGMVETRLSEQIDTMDKKIGTLDMKMEVQFASLNKMIEDRSEQIIDILTNTTDEILKMQDERISQIEEHLALDKPHKN